MKTNARGRILMMLAGERAADANAALIGRLLEPQEVDRVSGGDYTRCEHIQSPKGGDFDQTCPDSKGGYS